MVGVSRWLFTPMLATATRTTAGISPQMCSGRVRHASVSRTLLSPRSKGEALAAPTKMDVKGMEVMTG